MAARATVESVCARVTASACAVCRTADARHSAGSHRAHLAVGAGSITGSAVEVIALKVTAGACAVGGALGARDCASAVRAALTRRADVVAHSAVGRVTREVHTRSELPAVGAARGALTEPGGALHTAGSVRAHFACCARVIARTAVEVTRVGIDTARAAEGRADAAVGARVDGCDRDVCRSWGIGDHSRVDGGLCGRR